MKPESIELKLEDMKKAAAQLASQPLLPMPEKPEVFAEGRGQVRLIDAGIRKAHLGMWKSEFDGKPAYSVGLWFKEVAGTDVEGRVWRRSYKQSVGVVGDPSKDMVADIAESIYDHFVETAAWFPQKFTLEVRG